MKEYTVELKGTVTFRADNIEEAEESVMDELLYAFGYENVDIEAEVISGGECE